MNLKTIIVRIAVSSETLVPQMKTGLTLAGMISNG